MLKVAVTGNMGSGKSSVCRFFELLAVPVFYSDTEAKKLYSNPIILGKMVEKFGERILTDSGNLDTRIFASLIFNDKNSLDSVSSIIHPEVHRVFMKWCALHTDKPWCIQESAIIFETGKYRNFDRIILISAPEEILIQRIAKRDGSSFEEIRTRL
jgi:dephospho-CoA kinase